MRKYPIDYSTYLFLSINPGFIFIIPLIENNRKPFNYLHLSHIELMDPKKRGYGEFLRTHTPFDLTQYICQKFLGLFFSLLLIILFLKRINLFLNQGNHKNVMQGRSALFERINVYLYACLWLIPKGKRTRSTWPSSLTWQE